MIKRVLVPVDSSEHSSRAVSFATEMALRLDISLTFVHVLNRVLARRQLKRYVTHLESAPHPDEVEIDSVREALSRSGEEEGEALLEKVKAVAEELGVKEVDTRLEDGDPATVVVHIASGGDYDLIVLGRRGLGGLKGMVMGSVSHKVAATAACTVVMVN
jgi:nucleotide-binding universal stress UspA family protein